MKEEPWTKSKTDNMLDLYLKDRSIEFIAVRLGRSSGQIGRKINKFLRNLDNRATNYEPSQRVSRKGLPMSVNECKLIGLHRIHNVPAKDTARVLARALSDIQPNPKSSLPLANMTPSMDILLAMRYIYHVYKTPVITDEDYDGMKKEEIEFGAGAKAFLDYPDPKQVPDRVKTLALYLSQLFKDTQEAKR